MRDTAVKAADKLLKRYHEKGRFIQAWGKYGAADNYRLIIDCMMNLELLYWASEETGDSVYRDTAQSHAETTAMVILRQDGSAYHTFFFSPKTGNPTHGETTQGADDESAWARGQAWGVYGFPISYRYTRNELFKTEGEKLTNYFLNHLPEDNVCYWDLSFTDGNEERDSSAAAIAVCGLLEYADSCGGGYADIYKSAANAILRSLTENYTSVGTDADGVLLHGVYSKPAGLGIDECTIWGDYYYTEALYRLLNE